MIRRVCAAALLAILTLLPWRTIAVGVAGGLVFTSSANVNAGSAANLDDIAAGTVAAWTYETTATAGARIHQKAYLVAHSGYTYFTLNEGSTGAVSYAIARNTSDLYVRVASGYKLNQWQFVAAEWDFNGANVDQQLFLGDLNVPVAEVTGYVSQTVGSNTRKSDAAASLYIGNREASSTLSLTGSMAFYVMSNARLTLSELRQLQYRPSPPRGCVVFYRFSASSNTAKDECSTNAGVVTGATTSALYLPRVQWLRPAL